MIASAAALGWVVRSAYERRRFAERLGIRHPRRVLQCHLELLMMGGLFVAAGLAVEPIPVWVLVLLVFGGWVAPVLFLPVARDADIGKGAGYRILDTSALLALTGGWISMAVIGVSQ